MAGRPEPGSPDAAERRAAAGLLPAGGGLCLRCAHLRLSRGARTLFVRCALAASEPRLPRYPVLPVLACPGYRWREETR